MTKTRATRIAILAVLLLSLGALVLAGCGGGDDDEGGGETPPATTGEEATTEEATTEETEAGGEGDAEAGAAVFADNGCGNCHTLEAAGSTGTTGPNLDDLQPDFDTVVEQVTNGGGAMPAFGDMLSEQQINDVAAYVVESTGG
jgi:mono/diheme cytochrome c family protein